MAHEDMVIAPVAEQRTALLADVVRRGDPAGGLEVEGTQLLQCAVLRFGQQRDADLGRPLQRAVCGLGLLARIQCRAVKAAAAPAGRALGGAVAKDIGLALLRDDVRLAARVLHGLQRLPRGRWLLAQPGRDRRPVQATVPVHVLRKARLQAVV